MTHAAVVAAVLLVFVSCSRKPGASSSDADSASSAAAPPVAELADEVTPLADVAKMTAGARVKTRAFLWLFRPKCPPCPLGAKCEPCPPPFFQFSERKHAGIGSEPGTIVLADFAGPEPKLDVENEYLLEGLLEKAPSAPLLLRVEKIAVLAPSPDR